MSLNLKIQAFHNCTKTALYVSGSVTVMSESTHAYLTPRATQGSQSEIDLDLNFEQREHPAITKGMLKLIPIVEIPLYTGEQTHVNIYHGNCLITTAVIRPEEIATIGG